MPLDTPYGVIVGPLHDFDLVNPDTGQWPHYHVRLSAGGQVMDSAINLKSLSEVKIEYRRRQFSISDPLFSSVVALSDGLHPLAQTGTSGALDYVRHGGITGTSGWTLQTGNNLIGELNALLMGVARIYIFGATYSTGIGVHDVHMNQGDPNGSPFQHLDGIWQDGGVLFQYSGLQPRLEILQIKFETQSLHTDDRGLPIDIHFPRKYYVYIPRWKWPPGDPMKDEERRILVENGLFTMTSWAGVLKDVPKAVQTVLVQEIQKQVASQLPHSNPDHIARIADYVIKMGNRFASSPQ